MRFALLALALLLVACSDETTVDTAEEAAESVDLGDKAPLPTVPTTAEITLAPTIATAPPTTAPRLTTTMPTTPPTKAPSGCHPSYRGACVPADVSDVDCEGGSGNGPAYTGRVEVIGPDEYDLDRDGNGVGCE